MTFFKFFHSTAMVKFKKVVKRYILKLFRPGIDFLMYNSGLICIFVFHFYGNSTKYIINGKNHQRGLFKVV